MRTKVVALMGVLVIVAALAVPSPVAAGLLPGTTFGVTVDDSPVGTNFYQNVTLGSGTTTLDVGEMTLTQTIIPVNASSQWLILDFEATNGGLLAGNATGSWEILAGGIQITPGYLTGFFFDWTVNEVPTNPINTLGSFSPIETNPINPALGDVFGFFDPPSGSPYTGFYGYAYSDPYDGISESGMDPSTVNGFTLGFLETAVPEPSSLCLVVIGAVVLGAFQHVRGKAGSSGARP